jgi:hypothetical protein
MAAPLLIADCRLQIADERCSSTIYNFNDKTYAVTLLNAVLPAVIALVLLFYSVFRSCALRAQERNTKRR